MVPPTGASDSIVVARRHGASVEPRFGALSLPTKDQSMDSNEHRAKKSLGEKWKINKSGKSSVDGQMIETSNFMVHPDYLTKYGTLSNGVLTKSVKYAETWLYGTVGVRGAPTQRPSLFLYPGVVAPSPRIVNQNNYLASCGPYVGFPNYRSPERNGYVVGQQRKHGAKSPEPQCSDCGREIRSGFLCKKCGEKRTGTCGRARASLRDVRDRRNSAGVAPDPYALMRKSRLGVETSEAFGLERRKRNASASPLRRSTPASFETFKPKEIKAWTNGNEEWTTGDEVSRRKSILECDVNAYELNKNKLGEPGDSSDEFGENLLKGNAKLKILRPKLNKTEIKSNRLEGTKPAEEVRLNGQRFKIFDHSIPSTSEVEGYVSDDDECKKAKEPLIPRLPSPKRPPRRPKDKTLSQVSFKYSKSKSKSSPNLSIKSILKKPGDASPVLSSPAPSDETASSSLEPDFEVRQQPPVGKKQSQSTLKKKKQVQFRVNTSSESLNKPNGEKVPESPEGESTEDGVHRSKSCENLPCLLLNESETGSETKSEEDISHSEECSLTQTSQLKRSYSDRRPASALVLYKNDVSLPASSPPNSTLFNDTMALRTRVNRQDTRGVFEYEDWKKPDASEKSQKTPLPSNLISYEEFTKRTESPTPKKDTSIKKSKLPVTTKKKSQAPNPPPRQVAAKANKPKNGAVSIQVSSEGTKTSTADAKAKPEVEVNEEKTGKSLVKLNLCQEPAHPEPLITEGNRTSITISSGCLQEESKVLPQRKTSVMINTFSPQDSNKVTISVRNEEEPNASTCTIIETGSNSTVIPVVSTDNKTTLIVGSSPSPPTSAGVEEPPSLSTESPKPYIFSTVNSEVEFMDPVEAVRRNLVPHICGKEENGLSLMERIKQSRETKEQKNLKQISQLFGPPEEPPAILGQPPQFLLSSYKNKKGNWKSKPEEDSSTTTSRSNSFCSTLTSSVKNSSGNTSRSSSFRSSCYKSLDSDYDASSNKFYHLSDAEETSGQERDKLEYEYEIRNGIKDGRKEDGENIYETIKEEPIYDQIGTRTPNDESEDDVPPPLPLTLPPSLDEIDKRSTKSIFEGASKYDILNYLVDAKERVREECYFSGSSTGEEADGRKETTDPIADPRATPDAAKEKCDETASAENDSGYDISSRISNLSQTSYSSDDNMTPTVCEREAIKLSRKSSAEIERNDSGVGSETSHTSRSKWQAASSIREDPQHLCEDCDQVVETQVTDSGVMYAPLVCRKCSKRRSERKEIIQEITETEEKYGRDLKIILEEFYTPMLVAGLLTPDQLSAIFLNTEELLENSEQLTEKLRDTLEIAIEQGDEDFLTVNVGKIFLEAGPMLHAFESYCTRQGAAAVLLANLEKEKELLRIFLRVSQMENAVLRRMNLNSFLMVPVQRVTKYPLLLARLYKVTPPQQEGRELLKEAQHNIELHLEHMNSEAKDISATKVWRRFSTSAGTGRKSTSELEMINIKLRKMAVDVLDWNHEEVRFVMEGKLLYTQPTDNNWKKGRTIKLTPVFVLLVTLGKPNSRYKMDPPEDELTFPTKTGVREATLLLVKEKCGRYTLIREPLYLDKTIVCCETDVDEFFEIQELSTKDSFIFKAEDAERTKEWYRYLQYHAQILGSWRRRRNALANIMINGMMARAYTG